MLAETRLHRQFTFPFDITYHSVGFFLKTQPIATCFFQGQIMLTSPHAQRHALHVRPSVFFVIPSWPSFKTEFSVQTYTFTLVKGMQPSGMTKSARCSSRLCTQVRRRETIKICSTFHRPIVRCISKQPNINRCVSAVRNYMKLAL